MDLRDAFRHSLRKVRRSATRALRRSAALAVLQLLGATLAGVQPAFADPTLDQAHLCQVASPQEATSFANVLYERGEYQRAGECYQKAGNLERANVAFTKAVGPKGEVTGRALASQRDTAKSLIAGVQRAFRSNH